MSLNYSNRRISPQAGDTVECGEFKKTCVVVRVHRVGQENRLILRMLDNNETYETTASRCSLTKGYKPKATHVFWLSTRGWPDATMYFDGTKISTKRAMVQRLENEQFRFVGHNTVFTMNNRTISLHGEELKVGKFFYVDSYVVEGVRMVLHRATISEEMGIREAETEYRPLAAWNRLPRAGARVQIHTDDYETKELETGVVRYVARPEVAGPHNTLYAVYVPRKILYKTQYELTVCDPPVSLSSIITQLESIDVTIPLQSFRELCGDLMDADPNLVLYMDESTDELSEGFSNRNMPYPVQGVGDAHYYSAKDLVRWVCKTKTPVDKDFPYFRISDTYLPLKDDSPNSRNKLNQIVFLSKPSIAKLSRPNRKRKSETAKCTRLQIELNTLKLHLQAKNNALTTKGLSVQTRVKLRNNIEELKGKIEKKRRELEACLRTPSLKRVKQNLLILRF